MLVADDYAGHRDDPAVAARLDGAEAHRVVLTDEDRRRSRVRTETADGIDLGIVAGRVLEDGDVLLAGDAPVVVELASVEALVVDFGGADADVSPTTAARLGHAVGNRHRDLAVRGSEALFPASDPHERLERVVAAEIPDGVPTRYERVSPAVFDDAPGPDAHGGDGGDGHSHSHTRDDHSHDGEHTHPRGGDAATPRLGDVRSRARSGEDGSSGGPGGDER